MASDRPAIHDWTRDEIRAFGYRVVDLIAQHLTELPERPVFRPVPADLQRQLLDGTLPEDGRPAMEVLDEFARQIEPYPFGNGHPRFFGWVNSPPAVIGIFADALAAAMNPSCAGGNHAAVFVERQVVQWFTRLFGFPRGSMGLLVSGGSMASLTALAVARHVKVGFDIRAKGLQEPHARIVVYKTAEGHGCTQKAIELLGLGSENIRIVAHDANLRMLPSSLETALAVDEANGCIPMAVIASAGTVNTGAIDPIGDLADICERHRVWLHVDGAYGAPAILSSRYSTELAALARSDSLALDPHKWLYVPVEAGLVLIRDADAMRQAFSLVPPYLRTDGSATGVGGPPWLSEFGFQQTRSFRALKVWMCVKHHGLSGYKAAIEHDLSMADRLAERVRRSPDLQLFTPQRLSIVCFRYAPAGLRANRSRLNEINERLLQRLQLDGRVFVSSTIIDETFWLRACVINYRTTGTDVDVLPELVTSLGADLSPPSVDY
ncbi:MAG: aspartate aminotransferase family protein [Acidobacteria bacterium]|nr:aspartate aminotransferase family protein [Acidobacteriota bacterium]